jgi:hypothetical protein
MLGQESFYRTVDLIDRAKRTKDSKNAARFLKLALARVQKHHGSEHPLILVIQHELYKTTRQE